MDTQPVGCGAGGRAWGGHLCGLAGYLLVALLFAWPLPRHLSTHLLGPPSGDTGVYVWNQWVFRHEVVAHGRLPFQTSAIFSSTYRADLTQHNYTPFANVLAFPLQPRLGVVATFNIIYLALTVLNGYAMFLLARRVAGAGYEAWLAGLLFGWAPMLVARSTAHLSLVAAAPLPIFVLLLLRTHETGRAIWALAAGAALAWAYACDVYYAVYGLLIGVCYVGLQLVDIERSPAVAAKRWVPRLLEVTIAGTALIAIAIAISGGWRWNVVGVAVSFRTLYTPMLLLTVLALVRFWVGLRVRWTPPDRLVAGSPIKLVVAAAAGCLIPLLPILHGLGSRILEGRFAAPPIFWRSSPRGVDLVSFVLPNPMHPLFGAPWYEWLATWPGHLAENVSSLPFSVLALLALAIFRYDFRPPRLWTAITVVFALLALGPFVTVGGLNTHIPAPWALLRYVPVVGYARSPARFAIVVVMGAAVLLAFALQAVTRGAPRHVRGAILAAFTSLLVFELWPAPRTLYSAEVPSIYRIVAEDPRDVAVLELPFGLRDGTFSMGDFSAAAQYYQTFHNKRLLGGYLSRVSNHRRELYRRRPVLPALVALSEGRELTPEAAHRFVRRGAGFARRTNLRYVIIDRSRSSPSLVSLATQAFGLVWIAGEGARDLYAVTAKAEARAGLTPVSDAWEARHKPRGLAPDNPTHPH